MASEYGWSKHDILYLTYPDEVLLLNEKIRVRKITDRINTMQASLYGQLQPEARDSLINPLYEELNILNGIQAVPQLDRAGLARLKEQLGAESKMVKVK